MYTYCTSCLVRWKEPVELSSGSNSLNFAVPKVPNFLKSPFLGFWVIQTWHWPVLFSSDEALQIGGLLTSWFQLGKFFLLLKIYLLWKIWLISVKQWKSVWIHACIWWCLFFSGSNNPNFAVPILPVYQPDITIVFECLFYFISDLAFKMHWLKSWSMRNKQTVWRMVLVRLHMTRLAIWVGTLFKWVTFAAFCRVASTASNE